MSSNSRRACSASCSHCARRQPAQISRQPAAQTAAAAAATRPTIPDSSSSGASTHTVKRCGSPSGDDIARWRTPPHSAVSTSRAPTAMRDMRHVSTSGTRW